MPLGIKGVGLTGLTPIPQRGGALGLSPFLFDLGLTTFTPYMAKRSSAAPFAAGVLLQGKRDGTSGVHDDIQAGFGSNPAPGFWSNWDLSQGSIVFWITPEWGGGDGLKHVILRETGLGNIAIYKETNGFLYLHVGTTLTSADVSAWVAGTTYCVVMRYDRKNMLDGTNYACISVNDVHTFGRTTAFALTTVSGNIQFGGWNTSLNQLNALIEGFTVYRRVLYDGTYGENVGNGDEINLIYAAGAGADPCTITGSWDITLMIPTDSTVGALTTG